MTWYKVIIISIKIKPCDAKFLGVQMTKFDKMPHFRGTSPGFKVFHDVTPL